MLRDVVGQTVLETLEEKGISIDSFLNKWLKATWWTLSPFCLTMARNLP
jgi:hypothetical protein